MVFLVLVEVVQFEVNVWVDVQPAGGRIASRPSNDANASSASSHCAHGRQRLKVRYRVTGGPWEGAPVPCGWR